LAHAVSNSVDTFARDQTPLRNTSVTRFSSVAGFHIGHLGQPAVRTGVPPIMAGLPETASALLALLLFAADNDGLSIMPAAKTPADLRKLRRASELFLCVWFIVLVF
jgi:hypothetical protein